MLKVASFAGRSGESNIEQIRLVPLPFLKYLQIGGGKQNSLSDDGEQMLRIANHLQAGGWRMCNNVSSNRLSYITHKCATASLYGETMKVSILK